MPDIYCPVCSEPWDSDELHYEAESIAPDAKGAEYEALFYQLSARFRDKGCEAFKGASHAEGATADPVIAATYDLLGDDLDGAAAVMGDFESRAVDRLATVQVRRELGTWPPEDDRPED